VFPEHLQEVVAWHNKHGSGTYEVAEVELIDASEE
jgi:hypothetical protein